MVQISQRESIFCSKINSGGVLLYPKISSGGNQFWGVHFYHDIPLFFRQLPGTWFDGSWRAWWAADVIARWRGRTAPELSARGKHTVHWTDIGRWVVEHWPCLLYLYDSVPHYIHIWPILYFMTVLPLDLQNMTPKTPSM